MEGSILGVGLGLFNGGDNTGESLVVGPEVFRMEYVHLAAQSPLGFWRIHGVGLRMSGPSVTVRTSWDLRVDTASLSPQNTSRKLRP
jgi:hypothetical protein